MVSISTISHSSITSRNILTSFVLTRKTKEGRKETTKEFLFFGSDDDNNATGAEEDLQKNSSQCPKRSTTSAGTGSSARRDRRSDDPARHEAPHSSAPSGTADSKLRQRSGTPPTLQRNRRFQSFERANRSREQARRRSLVNNIQRGKCIRHSDNPADLLKVSATEYPPHAPEVELADVHQILAQMTAADRDRYVTIETTVRQAAASVNPPSKLAEAVVREEDMQQLLAAHIVRPFEGQALGTVRVFLVKEERKKRMRIIAWPDKINAKLKKLYTFQEHFPTLKNIKDAVLDSDAGVELDLQASYFQVPLPEDMHKFFVFEI